MSPDQYLDALLALPALHSAQVSPDGAWIAWTWHNAGPTANVFLVSTDGTQAPVQLTDAPQDTVLVSWAPDSGSVIVAQDHDGDERVQLLQVALVQPGRLQPLTEPSPPYFIHGGELHPNARWLVYGANYDFGSGVETEPSIIYRHDLRSGDRAVLARPTRANWTVPRLNRQGTHVLYERNDAHPGGAQLWLADVDGTRDREIVSVGDTRKVSGAWLPDGSGILVLAETPTHRRVGLWRLEDGSLRWLIDDPARAIEAASPPIGSAHAVILEVRGARARASLLDLETGRETPLPDVPGDLVPIAPIADGRWVGLYRSSRQPSDLVLFAPEDARVEAFTSLTRIWDRTSLRQPDLTAAEPFHWRSVDAQEVQGWLYRARGRSRGAIVYVHGGPTAHSSDAINKQIQFFAAQGFTVLDPNYRGSTGFGLAFQDRIKEDGWGGREQDDIRTGIEALIAAGIAEPGRIGITGTSYGGYSSWWAITHFPRETIAASAPICGMTDLVVDYQTTRPDLRPYSEEMLGGRPDQVPERYRERSPIHQVGQITGRLLIVQGLQDPNVTPENVRVVCDALDAARVPYDLLAFEDEGHGIGRPKNQRTLYIRLVDFFGEAFALA